MAPNVGKVMIRLRSPSDSDLDALAARLSATQPTYPNSSRPASDYRTERWSTRLSPSVTWEEAKDALRAWRAHLGAGVRVRPAWPPQEDQTVAVAIRVGPAHVLAACRITRTLDTESEFGFTYATLPGHPEDGEESFVLYADADGRLRFEITATSRHADALVRLGGPISGTVRRSITNRYLRLGGLS